MDRKMRHTGLLKGRQVLGVADANIIARVILGLPVGVGVVGRWWPLNMGGWRPRSEWLGVGRGHGSYFGLTKW